MMSHAMMWLAIVIMAATGLYALTAGAVSRSQSDFGAVFASPDQWVADNQRLSFWLNIAALGCICILMHFITRAYKVPRTMTVVHITLFAVMCAATPMLTVGLCSGTVVCLLTGVAMVLMFSCFGNPRPQRRVFLAFFILSGAASCQYAFAVYIPVFLAACAQMRIFTLRTVLAALLSIITPWWLLFGFGVITLDDLHLPQIVSIFASIDLGRAIVLLTTVALTVVLCLSAYLLTILKLITYNAQTRARNGFLTLLTLVTAIAMAVDYSNLPAYLTMFNFCTSFMLAHLITIHAGEKSGVGIALIIITYLSLYVWTLAI